MLRVRDDQKTRQDKRQTITKIAKKITIRQSQDKRKDNDKGKNKKTTTIDRQTITKASTKATTTSRQNRAARNRTEQADKPEANIGSDAGRSYFVDSAVRAWARV